MYILGGYCGYCGTQCSRADDGNGLPNLITPELPFIKDIVCEPCWKKLRGKLTQMVNDLMGDPSK